MMTPEERRELQKYANKSWSDFEAAELTDKALDHIEEQEKLLSLAASYLRMNNERKPKSKAMEICKQIEAFLGD